MSQSNSVHDTGAEILHDHIGGQRKCLQPYHIISGLEIQDDRFLATIDGLKQQAFPVPEGSDMPVIITPGTFYLDDFGTNICRKAVQYEPDSTRVMSSTLTLCNGFSSCPIL